MKKRMPKSIRKFIREEKARIRREVLDVNEHAGLISEIYKKLADKSEEQKKESKKEKQKKEEKAAAKKK